MAANDPSREGQPIVGLTWREQEVLALLVERLTNREVGERLHLTETTVKSHVGSILGKLAVKNRRQAVARARELGLLEPSEPSAPEPTPDLPADTTPFLGRVHELAEIRRLLAGTRLLTLTGPGGIGKTRLALQAARAASDQFTDGVFFVDLAPIAHGRHLIPAIAEALRFPLSTEAPPLEQLTSHLRRRRLLLVLDNFDRLLGDADVVAGILQAAPDVKVLATSRENLNLQAEAVLRVTGMEFPSAAQSADRRQHGAVELFVTTVHRIQPDFRADEDALRHISNICQLVEGMPLAIELAAAWMNVLSLEGLEAEMQRGLEVFTTQARDVPERHRSMRAVFDQSWSLLTQVGRHTMMRLSVFRGGFTREAAEAVAGATLQSLADLVSRSFLRHDAASGRFEIHELLRQYAEEQLGATPQGSAPAREAHAAYFAGFMGLCWQRLRDRRQKAALAEIDADLQNIRTAWRHSVAQANAAQMEKFINSFWLLYWFRGWNHEAEALFGEASAALDAERAGEEAEVVRALALAHRAYFKTWLGNAQQGYELANQSVANLERLDRPVDLALALGSLNLASDFLTRYEDGEAAARRMVEIATRQDEKWLLALALYKLSVANSPRQDYEERIRLAQQSMKIYEGLGESLASILTLVNLGHHLRAVGEHERAREIYLRCVRTSEQMDYRWGIANGCKYLSQMALAANQTAQAKTYLLRSLKIVDDLGLGRDRANLLCDLARIRLAENRPERALELIAAVMQQPESQLHRLGGGSIRDSVQDLLDELKGALPPKSYSAAWSRGQALEMDQVVVDALAES